jgi:hypothetical protein
MKTVFLTLKFEFPSLSTYGSTYVVPQMHATDDDGSILLTPECASIGELETNIEIMRSDLDKILAEARKRFAAAEAAGPQPIF